MIRSNSLSLVFGFSLLLLVPFTQAVDVPAASKKVVKGSAYVVSWPIWLAGQGILWGGVLSVPLSFVEGDLMGIVNVKLTDSARVNMRVAGLIAALLGYGIKTGGNKLSNWSKQ